MTDYGRARIWDNDNSKWLDLVGNPVGGVVEGIVFDGDLHVTGDIYSGAVGNEGDELHVGPLDGDLDGYIDDKLALYLPLAGGTMLGAINMDVFDIDFASGGAIHGNNQGLTLSLGTKILGTPTAIPFIDFYQGDSVIAARIIADKAHSGGSYTGGLRLNAGQVKFEAGSGSAPSITFTADEDTGFFRPAGNQLGLSVGGVQTTLITSNAFTFGTNATGDPRIKLNGGSAAEPSYGFAGDTDTGMYRGAADQLGFATGGAERMYIVGSSAVRFGGTTTGYARINFDAADASNPTYSFNADTDTGMYRSGANSLNFTTGGTSRLTLSTSAATFGTGFTVSVQGGATNGQLWYRSNPEAQSGNAAVWFSDGGVYKLVRTSSLRAHKEKIREAPELADIELKPWRFRRKGEDFFQYGVMVDDLVEQDKDLGIWDKEEKRYDDFFDRGLMAVMIAKINRLEGLVL